MIKQEISRGSNLPSRCRTACVSRRLTGLREADPHLSLSQGPVRAGHAEDDEPVRGVDTAEGAGEPASKTGVRRRRTPTLLETMQEYRDYAGVDRGHERRLHTLCSSSPRCSTLTVPRWPPTLCT